MKHTSLLVVLAAFSSASAAFAAADLRDAARDALTSSILSQVGAAADRAAALRSKALHVAPDAKKVRLGEWKEIWPARPTAPGSGIVSDGRALVTNAVRAEIWNDAIQAALDAQGGVFVPARDKPYYLDGPIVLASGQAFVADPKAEFRLVPNADTCLVRNKSVVGMHPQTLRVLDVPYDQSIYVEGGIWTTLKTARNVANGNHAGRPTKKNPVHGCYGAFVFNHVDGLVVKDVAIRQCNMHAIQLSDAHHFRVDGVAFDRQGRDGVHVHGMSDWGVIRRVSGDSGDDFIALNAWDWAHTSPNVGPIHHVLVEDCTCADKKNLAHSGCGTIRIQPGNRKRPDGKGVVACPVERCVFRRLVNVRGFKMYDQPNLEMGRDKDRSEPIGTMRALYFHDLAYDRPGVFEIADHVEGCDISRVLFRHDAIGKDFVRIMPISGTWKHGADPSKWVEIYSPDEDFTVRDFSLRNVAICADGLETGMDPKAFVRVADGKLNPDYPKTTPRGGTGKVTFEWFPNVVDTPMRDGGEMPADAVLAKMEAPADAARVAAWKKAHPAPFWLFGEERRLAVRVDRIPAHWFENPEGPARTFTGEAEPDEDFVFQVCVASDAARAFTWAISCTDAAVRAKMISRTAGNVRAGGLQPLWACVRPPVAARGKTLAGVVTVTDAASGEKVSFPWSIKVKDAAPVARHGADDAWRLARLDWLDSDVGDSLDEPTRPFTPVVVDEATRTLKILGRDLVLAENGLPAAYRTYFNGSCTKIGTTPTAFFAEPVSFEPNAAPFEKRTSVFKFTERRPCRVAWEATTDTGSCTFKVVGSLAFDGFASFKIFLAPKSADGVTCAPELKFAVPRALARYQMGLGRPGGTWPETLDWKWNVENQQDATWFGAPHAGMMLRLKGANFVRPLCNVYYKWRKLNLPESWGTGGIRFRTEGGKAVVTAFGGTKRIAAGAPSPTYGFDLYLTPFKTANLKRHCADRIFHFSQRSGKVDFKQLAKDGVTIAIFHHNTRWNPYINYPFNDDGGPLLKKAVQEAHAAGIRLKLYYTTRELTQNLPEFFALTSMGDEIFFRCPPDMPGRTCINPSGPHPWLAEHVGADVLPAWRENVRFPDSYPPKPDLAVITQPDSRWNNYYLAGLEMLVKEYGIDGLYIDDTALDRASMQRARRILDADGNDGRRIDMHSWNHASGAAGKGNSPIVFLELYPYYDLVWHGEGFKADTPPEFWLVERSGVPFGLLGQYLGKGNPFQTLVFAQTDRAGWGGSVMALWKFFDAVGLPDAELFGWWDDACPVKTSGATDVKATVYKLPGRCVIACYNFGKTDGSVSFKPDWAALGLDGAKAKAALAAIDGVQKPAPFDLAAPCPFPAHTGRVIVVE